MQTKASLEKQWQTADSSNVFAVTCGWKWSAALKKIPWSNFLGSTGLGAFNFFTLWTLDPVDYCMWSKLEDWYFNPIKLGRNVVKMKYVVQGKICSKLMINNQ